MQRFTSISPDPVATAQRPDSESRRSSYSYTPSIATTIAQDPVSDIQPLLEGATTSPVAVSAARKLSQSDKAKALSILSSSPEKYCHPDHWKFNSDKSLLWAAAEGNAEVIILLLDGWRRDPAPASKSFRYPSLRTQANVIKASSVDVRTPERWTPLMFAVSRGHEKAAKILLENYNANVEAQTGIENLTPLHIAVRFGHKHIVKLLIEAGANIEARDETGKTVLLHCIQRVEARDESGQSFQLRSIQRGEPDLLDILWKAGANGRATDGSGNTALHLAMLAIRDAPGHKIDSLLEHGLDVNARNKKGVTPLMYAASQAYEYGVRTLLAAGALHETDNAGWTALCWAYSCRGYQWDTWDRTFDILTSNGAVCPHGKAFHDRL